MGQKLIIITLFLLLGSWSTVFSQPQQPPVNNFTPADFGISQPPEIYAIAKDDRGFIYAGSVGGVMQFDGYSWNFIKVLTGEKINDIHYAGNNVLAVGGLNYFGLLLPDIKGTVKFKTLKSLLPKEIENFEIITIQSSREKVFFQSENGLFIYDLKKEILKLVRPEKSFFRGYEAGGRYFVRDRGKGLMEWSGGKLKLFSSDTVSKNYGYFGIVDYNKEKFLAATHDLGFYLIDKKTGETEIFESFFYYDFLPQIYEIEKINDDLFALATVNLGVVLLDKNLELKMRVGRNEGLRSSLIKQICADHSGRLWAATSGGVSVIDIHSPIHIYNENTGIPGNVEDVQQLGTIYYAGSSSGLYFLPDFYSDDQKPWRKTETDISQVYDLDVNDKDVLVASAGGLYAGTLNSFKKIADGDFNTVRYIPRGKYMVALTPDELFVFNEKYQIIKQISVFNDGQRIQRSHTIEFDTSDVLRTRIWVGLGAQGVLRIDITDNNSLKTDVFTELDGLMPGFVKPGNFLGKIIFLTENGLQHFIPEEEVAKSLSEEQKNDPAFNRGYFDVFTIPNTKIKGNISFMKIENGKIYVSLNDKLCYFDEKGKLHSKEFASYKLGRVNNLVLLQGRLWIPAADGIAVFHPGHYNKINRNFKLYFRKINTSADNVIMQEYFNEDTKFTSEQTLRSLELNYSDNSLHFVLASDYFDIENPLEFSWYLEGSDEKWSKWSKNNTISINNIHEGSYILHVKARNIYGAESEEALFYFTILPPWYRTLWAYIGYFILIILIIWAAVKVSGYRLKQNNIRLENIVKERTNEIASKNEELQYQNHQILHQKQEITDSINYAKRIQEAILPVKKEIERVFPDSFVLFKPKDIVSGDFYWFAHHNMQSIIVCADCTGHGVPGAFMSMICTDRINHTVLEKKITTPSALLSEVNQGIKRSLKQEDESNLKTKDGMDAAVCLYDHTKGILFYSGANRPLWLLRNGEISEYKPTKMAVGGFTPEDQVYDELQIKIEKGDIVYLSTDGYADQFGGPRGKKLMVKAFKEILLQKSALPFNKQCTDLDKFIEDWRNTENESGENIEQVDDMCVMGIKF
jgi:serine phosphatase RsbU (regulator of sigma subunit)